MKTKLILILIAFTVSNAFAQSDNLSVEQRVNKLEEQINNQQERLDAYYEELKKDYWTYRGVKSQVDTKYNNQEQTIDSLQKIIDANNKTIQTTASELGFKIEDNQKAATQSISDLGDALSKNTLYWIIAILVVALFVLLVFVFLRKQIFKQKTDLDSNIQETRKVLEEEGVKLDNKLIEVLETQLKIIDNKNSSSGKEADHTLALKVADEIIRIQKNLTRMDEKTKGLKQLTASVKRIQDNFASNGYELIEMIGKKYDEGMKASVTYNPDSDEESGIIIRIIKPQVNFKNQMIQAAQIEVSE